MKQEKDPSPFTSEEKFKLWFVRMKHEAEQDPGNSKLKAQADYVKGLDIAGRIVAQSTLIYHLRGSSLSLGFVIGLTNTFLSNSDPDEKPLDNSTMEEGSRLVASRWLEQHPEDKHARRIADQGLAAPYSFHTRLVVKMAMQESTSQ